MNVLMNMKLSGERILKIGQYMMQL